MRVNRLAARQRVDGRGCGIAGFCGENLDLFGARGLLWVGYWGFVGKRIGRS